MKKILWWSRGVHFPTPTQKEELRRIVGDEEITFVYRHGPIVNAEEVLTVYYDEACNDLVLIAPLGVIVKVAELGRERNIVPLKAEMRVVEGPFEDGDYFDKGSQTFSRFIRFVRVFGLNTKPA